MAMSEPTGRAVSAPVFASLEALNRRLVVAVVMVVALALLAVFG